MSGRGLGHGICSLFIFDIRISVLSLSYTSYTSQPVSKMALKLQEIDPETDFHELSRCLFEAHEDPLQKFFHLWFPIHGSGEQARESAIKEGATRLKRWHTEDPSSNWRKVVDTQSGKIAGASLWNIYTENPFAEPDNLEVTWFPEGGAREFVEQMLVQYDGPRSQAAQKPHICMPGCFIFYTFRIRRSNWLLYSGTDF